MLTKKQILKTVESQIRSYKQKFYLNNLQIKTDFSRFKKFHRHFHPSYYDVERNRTNFQREIKDNRHLEFKTSDPLYMHDDLGFLGIKLEDQIAKLATYDITSKDSNEIYSPYKIISLLYNMVERGLHLKFPKMFTDLDRLINTAAIPTTSLEPRYLYGYLMTAYKTDACRPEVVQFFENLLPQQCVSFRIEETIAFLEALFFQKKDMILYKLIIKLVSVNIHYRYEKEIKRNSATLIKFGKMLQSLQLFDEPHLWDLFINDIKVRKNLHFDQVHELLKPLHYYYDNPDSKRYKDPEIMTIINAMKEKIKISRDESYLYNEVKECRYTFDELIAKKDEISEKTHVLVYEDPKEDFSKRTSTEIKVEWVEYDVIYKEYESRLKAGEKKVLILENMKTKYSKQLATVDLVKNDYENKLKSNLINKLMSENKFNDLFKRKPVAKPTAPVPGQNVATDTVNVKAKKKGK